MCVVQALVVVKWLVLLRARDVDAPLLQVVRAYCVGNLSEQRAADGRRRRRLPRLSQEHHPLQDDQPLHEEHHPHDRKQQPGIGVADRRRKLARGELEDEAGDDRQRRATRTTANSRLERKPPRAPRLDQVGRVYVDVQGYSAICPATPGS